jgi:hypothetical protein
MLSNRKIAKGMMFGGCSFTWGQGLYYYSNLDTLREPLPDHYDQKLLTQAHLDHMKILRFPRLVANHFNTWEVVHPWNSGSNYSIIKYWEAAFNNTDPYDRQWTHKQYEYSEISHFVFQLTQHHRDNFWIEWEGEKYFVPFHEVTQGKMQEIFLRWLDSKNLTLDQWMDNYIQENIDRVYTFLKNLEDKGIKTTLMVWPNNYMEYVTKNPWLKERLISFKYKGHDYSNIQDMMMLNKELEIKHDTDNFIDTPKDHHPSLLCHQVMAQHVIDKIESL